jgi:hypothetical protein
MCPGLFRLVGLALFASLAASAKGDPATAVSIKTLTQCEGPVSKNPIYSLYTFIHSKPGTGALENERSSVADALDVLQHRDLEFVTDPRRHLALREEIRQEAAEKWGAGWFNRAESLSRKRITSPRAMPLLEVYGRFMAADLNRTAYERQMARSTLDLAVLRMKQLMLENELNDSRLPSENRMEDFLQRSLKEIDGLQKMFEERVADYDQLKAKLFKLACKHSLLIKPIYTIAGSQLEAVPKN